jgi:ATP-dependent helicase YprA (DUF1998 family)
MASVYEARCRAHAERRALSYKILDDAHARSFADASSFDSKTARARIIENIYEITEERMRPRNWQLDIAEAILLGLDCTVIAGTGSGKSLPFGLPLLAGKEFRDRTVVVICPLNALEADLVS